MSLEDQGGSAILRFAGPDEAEIASRILRNWEQIKGAMLVARTAMSDLKQREWSTCETEAALCQVNMALAVAGVKS